ncbi:UNVERIFIED_CONTAM: hypothetical protein K2H54_040509 [Gekko kuhli]
MEADPVLTVLLAIMAAEVHLQQFKEVAQRSTFNWLVDALRDVLHRRRTEMRAPVSVERRVAVAVWWMANNMSYRAVAHQFGLVRSTVAGIVVEVTGAITERLLERVVYLRDPDKDMSWSAIMSGGPCPCQLPSARPATMLNLHLSRMRITADKKTFKTKMAYSTRGVLWLGEEVECMIQTLLDQEAGPRVITSTHLETQDIFEEVASAMCAHGYRRTGAQVRAKFKCEKVAFFDALEDWHGLPPPPGIDSQDFGS